MSITCGLQCLTCDYPINLDTYRGCSHACKYCFVKQKHTIEVVTPLKSVTQLKHFIEGKRGCDTRWCDWKIPLHFGANTDPFQEAEREYRCSYECLEVFAETKYPVIISTKNPVLLSEEPYLSALQQCNVVLQVSMACSKYDKLETGAPTYEERLNAISLLSDKVKRVIVRVRPYFPDCHKDIISQIPRWKEAGAYGVSIGSFITKKKTKGMKRYGNNYMFPLELLETKYAEIKRLCHENGLRFFCCEEGMECTGDDLTCCGTECLEGFNPNRYNLSHLAYDEDTPKATEAMKKSNTYRPFKAIGQNQIFAKKIYGKSFEELMLELGSDRIDYLKRCKERYDERE